MEKNEIKETALSKDVYTFEMLLNDILEISDQNTGKTTSTEKAEREYSHKLVVMQTLIYLAKVYSSEEYKDDDKLRNAIDIKVNGDEMLSGYLFYISQNPQFDYSWNYMRKRKKSYSAFLAEAIRFLDSVLADIKMLVSKPRLYSDVHMVFDDFFDVALTSDKPYVRTRVLWENFHRVAMVKRNYYIRVKIKDSLLAAGTRKEEGDAEKLIDSALDMLNNKVGESE